MDPDLPEFMIADVVVSTAGRDAGTLFYVIEQDETYLQLANGKDRSLEKPKCKKRKHARKVLRSETRVAQKLIDVTKQSFFEGIRFAKKGHRVSDISHAIQTYVESNGFSVVRSFVGHGVGAQLHEEPEVPNYGAPGRGPRLLPGMTLAIEPMVNVGTYEVQVLKDRWTTVTADGKLSAHYENTVLITDGEPEILTVAEL